MRRKYRVYLENSVKRIEYSHYKLRQIAIDKDIPRYNKTSILAVLSIIGRKLVANLNYINKHRILRNWISASEINQRYLIEGPYNPRIWYTDLKHGIKYPAVSSKKILNMINSYKKADAYYVMYPNTLRYLPLTSLMYRVSNNKSYAELLLNIISSWCESNPVGIGPGWLVPMQASIRSIKIVIALALLYDYLIENYSNLSQQLRNIFLSLYEHGVYIEEHLEWEKYNNHLMINLSALAILGLIFLEVSSRARDWFLLGYLGLHIEGAKQFSVNGVNYEGSLPYHGFVLSFYLIVKSLLNILNVDYKDDLNRLLMKATETLAYLHKPNGFIPIYGDDGLEDVTEIEIRDRRDKRHLIFLSTCLDLAINNQYITRLMHHYIKSCGIPLEALFCTSIKYKSSIKDQGRKRSFTIIKDLGDYMVLAKDDLHLSIRTPLEKPMVPRGHRHCDLFSYELFWGDDIVVDPGNLVYIGNTSLRRMYRSSSHHNIMKPNKKEICVSLGNDPYFYWIEYPKVTKLSKESKYAITIAATANIGSHRFTRLWSLMRNPLIVRISDIIYGEQAGHFISYIHTAPMVEVKVLNRNEILLITKNSAKIRLAINAFNGIVEDIRLENYLYAIKHGIAIPGKKIKIFFKKENGRARLEYLFIKIYKKLCIYRILEEYNIECGDP